MQQSLAVSAIAAMAVAAVAIPSRPAVAQTNGFADVPEDAYYTVPVAQLAARGVFAGTECDDGSGFCPAKPIDRKTMAVWIVRVVDGSDPPAVAQSRFDDVDANSFHAPFIERMAELEITGGCDDGSGFCPDRSVTRAQMAVFLANAYDLPEGPDPGFGDVPADAWYAAAVAKPVASRITSGCDDGTTFCPGRDTTRAQMAAFLNAAENRGEVATPPPYKSITTAIDHACAIQADDTVTCWGYNTAWQVSDPGGEFLAVSAGRWHNCGLRPDRTIFCWGYNGDGQLDAPAGEFSHVSAGDVHNCARRTDATIVCWGQNRIRKAEAPSGEFISVEASNERSCGLRTDNTITCWGSNGSGQLDVPDGQYRQLSTGESIGCALRTDGTVACWGNHARAWEIPDGRFTSVSAGRRHACGLRPDNTITCWGDNDDGQTDTPSGSFIDVAAGNNHSCGVLTDESLVCWGDNEYGQIDAPDGSFSKVVAGNDHSCAIATDDTVVCWGANWWGKSNAPAGSFKDVAGGRRHPCGLRSDDTISCWGVEIIAMPRGAGHAISPRLPDPSDCRPYGRGFDSSTAGLPLPSDSLPARAR